MAISYTFAIITITDEIGNRPPIVLPSSASVEEVEAALLAYHPFSPPDPEWVAFAWAIANNLSLASAALLAEILVWAEQCNLPPDFLAALRPQPPTG